MPFKTRGRKLANLVSITGLRWALNFDGVGVRGVLANRAINPDGDIDIEFYTPDVITSGGTNQVIISQTLQPNDNSLSEFCLFFSASTGNLGVVVKGTVLAIANAGQYVAARKYRWTLIGSTGTLTDLTTNQILVRTLTRGTVSEPSAQTVVGSRANVQFFKGIQRDIKINGTLWPMADRNQAIQLPEPSGLGAEIITQTVLENPVSKGSHWTYLGAGRWQYIGDSTLNGLQFQLSADQPSTGYLEFEVESISGTGAMTCSVSTASNGGSGVFDAVGVKRYFYTDKGTSSNNTIQFKRNAGTVSCIIKNISFKPLGTSNPMTISNATIANWVEVPV